MNYKTVNRLYRYRPVYYIPVSEVHCAIHIQNDQFYGAKLLLRGVLKGLSRHLSRRVAYKLINSHPSSSDIPNN